MASVFGTRKDGFKFSRHDSRRLQTFLDNAVKEKRLTKVKFACQELDRIRDFIVCGEKVPGILPCLQVFD